MKKVIRLSESDLENIVRKVIQERVDGVAFGSVGNGFGGSIETKEQSISPIPSSRTILYDKWNQMFPDLNWYNEARTKKINFENYNEIGEPNFIKLYDVYRKFIDPKVPLISENTAEDFYLWLQSFVDRGLQFNLISKFHNDINSIAQFQKGMLPILKMSGYPHNTKEYETALTDAKKIDPTLSSNKWYNTVRPESKRAYEIMTKM
jgi:hypothetical protein